MFGLSPAMTGGVIGLAFGVVTFIALRAMVAKLEGNATTPVESQQIRTMKRMALIDLFIFPVIGYVVGPMLF
ncbi:MAG: hypothetical protein AAFR23_02840 [Pseudomonadota bacterium]